MKFDFKRLIEIILIFTASFIAGGFLMALFHLAYNALIG